MTEKGKTEEIRAQNSNSSRIREVLWWTFLVSCWAFIVSREDAGRWTIAFVSLMLGAQLAGRLWIGVARGAVRFSKVCVEGDYATKRAFAEDLNRQFDELQYGRKRRSA